MIGVVAAMRREVEGLLRGLEGVRRSRAGPCLLHHGSLRGVPMVVVVTGMGAPRATAAARSLLANAPVTALASLGFAGALIEALAPGALALPDRVILDGGVEPPATCDPRLRARLATPARAAGLDVRGGVSVTAARMVTGPAQRTALAVAYGAELVDMEGYWLAREAAAEGVPFVCVRAVSDGLDDHHPVLAEAVAGGDLSVSRLLGGYLGRPREAAKLPRLAANARAASRALQRFALTALPALAAEARP